MANLSRTFASVARVTSLTTALLVTSAFLLTGCKTGGNATTGSSPMDVAVAKTSIQIGCKGTDSEFNMRFYITGLQRNPEVESQIKMDVINNTNNEKVVKTSLGSGYFSDKEYLYVRYSAGGLTLDWQDGQYFGAATVNGNPEETAVEVKCDASPLTNTL